jgi:hypothetical protein
MQVHRMLTVLALSLTALALPVGALAQDRLTGSVQSVDGDMVWLGDGSSFQISDATRIAVAWQATAADLHPGQFVAITATRQGDGSLLASIINGFPASSQTFEGQRPMDGDNIMTNAFIESAMIDDVSTGVLEVTFLGNSERVQIAPDAQLVIRSDGTTANVMPGMSVVATVTDGVASSITLQ